jgi:hypothetical protein
MQKPPGFFQNASGYKPESFWLKPAGGWLFQEPMQKEMYPEPI